MKSEKIPRRLGEILIDEGVVTKDQIDIALTEQKKVKEPLGKLLVSLGFCDRVDYALRFGRGSRTG